MRIILATSIFPPDIGGPAIYVEKLLQGLKARSFEVAVLSYSKLKKYPKGSKHFLYFFKLFKLSKGADIIYAFNILSCGLSACMLSWLLRKKFIIRLGGDYLWEKRVEQGKTTKPLREYYEQPKTIGDRFWIFLQKQVLKRTDRIIFTSNFQKEIYKKHFSQLNFLTPVKKFNQIKEEKTIVIPNPFPAIDHSSFIIHNSLFTILYAGRLAKCKNIDMLIEVFNKVLKKTNKPLKLKIIGKKPVPHQEVLKEIQKSWLCVLPSLTEISPNFALECIALQKPILLTKENGLRKEITEKLILIDPQDPADLEEKMLLLLDSKHYQNYVARIKSIDKSYSWEQVIEKHIILFDTL